MLLKEETANELGAKLIASCGIFEVDRHDLEQMVNSMNSSSFFGYYVLKKQTEKMMISLGSGWEECWFGGPDLCSQIFLEVKFVTGVLCRELRGPNTMASSGAFLFGSLGGAIKSLVILPGLHEIH